MKELSIEQKAKRYEEVLAMAKEYVTYIPGDVANYIFNMFPELKESTDEGIRESIAGFLKTISSLKDGQTVSNEDFDTKVILEWVAWLKKQGKVKENEDSFIQWDEDERIREDLIEWFEEFADLNWLNWRGHNKRDILAWLTKQSKQQPRGESAPEVIKELKYKDGDWIVYDNNVYKIVNIPHDNYYECLGIDNTIRVYNSSIDDKSHLWTIKDAKAGDVLYYNDDIIVIFKYFHDDSSFCSYCYIDGGVFFTSNDRTPVWWMNNVFYPATKEQRELLFTKMKESGHEWDADKKELVEQMTGEEHKQYMLEHQDETIYDMSFEEAQDYLSKRGFDIPWNDGDVMVDERKLTQTVANVLKWADRHPLILPVKKK